MDTSSSNNRLVHSVSTSLQKISQNVSSIQRMVEQIGTSNDSEQLRTKLHEIQHYTGTLAKDTSNSLKDLAAAEADATTDERQWKIQKDRLVNDFSVVLTNFQAAQRAAAQKEKASMLRARANSGLNPNPFGDTQTANAPEQQPPAPAAPTGPSAAQLAMEKNVNLQEIQERERSLKALESDILDVNQIFRDLAVLVHDQGDMIDSIEANVEEAGQSVNQGFRDVIKADQYKQGVRRKRMICGGIIAATVFFVLIIIILTSD